MRTLVIDTATRACSVALFDDNDVVSSQYDLIGRGHAERLLPLIAALPDRGRAERIAVNIGPGSFTGIRVGISAAKALALAWDAKCFGYSCLALVAAMARAQTNASSAIDVLMTGGHGEYFYQAFTSDGIEQGKPVSLELETAARSSAAPVIAGDVAPMLAQYRPDANIFEIFPDALSWPLIANDQYLPASPVYGRSPDAKPMASA